MSFAQPGAWWWAALAAVVAAVYLLQLGRQEHAVATFGLWQRALARRPAWFVWRFRLSLAVQVVFVLLLVAALTQPFWQSVAAARRNWVLVLDVSASMSATVGGQTRFAQLQDQAQQIIGDWHRGEQMALVTASSTCRIACRWTDDRRVLLDALEQIAPTDGATGVSAGVGLARLLLADRPNPRVVVLTDACFPEATELSKAEDVQLLRIGEPAANVGITRCAPRPNPLDPATCEVLVEVTNCGDQNAARTLEVGLADAPATRVKLDVPANTAVRRVLPVQAARGGRLTARLTTADALAGDDAVQVELPARHKLVVRMATTGAEALEAALRANPRIEFQPAGGDRAGKPPPSGSVPAVTVLYRQVPEQLPPGPLLVVEPRQACELWTTEGVLRDAACAVHQTQAASPLLAGVEFGSYVVEQAARLKFQVPVEALVTATSGDALYSAIQRPKGRVLVLHANLEKSDLTRRGDFPQLLDNALQWLSPVVESEDSPLTDARESDLRPAAEVRSTSFMPSGAVADQPLWVVLVGLAIGWLLVEWCLFHRRIVV
jgi:hypothetical protein